VVRIGHGVLVAVGLGWLGLALWTGPGQRASGRRGVDATPARTP
jgi:hypothetical protein